LDECSAAQAHIHHCWPIGRVIRNKQVNNHMPGIDVRGMREIRTSGSMQPFISKHNRRVA
jgi:hypothetical protein